MHASLTLIEGCWFAQMCFLMEVEGLAASESILLSLFSLVVKKITLHWIRLVRLINNSFDTVKIVRYAKKTSKQLLGNRV